MCNQLAKDEKALKAMMIAGMICKRRNKQLGVKWKPSLPYRLQLDLWVYLFVECGMSPKEADEWIEQRLNRWWKQLQWLCPLPFIVPLVFCCPLALLKWLGAPKLLLVPLLLGMILLWIGLFVYRVFYFENCIERYNADERWYVLLKKCREAFPLRRISWICVPMAVIVMLPLLPIL